MCTSQSSRETLAGSPADRCSICVTRTPMLVGHVGMSLWIGTEMSIIELDVLKGAVAPVEMVRMIPVPADVVEMAVRAVEVAVVAGERAARRSVFIRQTRSAKIPSTRMSRQARGAPAVPARMPTERGPTDAPRRFSQKSRSIHSSSSSPPNLSFN